MKSGKDKQSSQGKPQKDYMYLAFKYKEYLWLAFSIIALVISIYQLIVGTREEAIYFVAITMLSGLFYSFNRFRRKKFEKRMAEQHPKK